MPAARQLTRKVIANDIPPFNGLTQLRFLRSAETGGLAEDSCWIWQGNVNGNGYGRFPLGNTLILAHRLSYEMFVGPISAGMNICHSCDVRLCVNPMHLWEGTQSENLKDAFKKGRMHLPTRRGEQNARAKLTESEVRSIRHMARKGITKAHLARVFSVSQSNVGDIVSRRTWSSIY
jgi:hypothetical protein